jgi:hypothetical protein
MKTQLTLKYKKGIQKIKHVDLSNDLNRELIDVIDDINQTWICSSKIIKVSVCFLDVKSYKQMHDYKLTKSVLKQNIFYFDDWGNLEK